MRQVCALFLISLFLVICPSQNSPIPISPKYKDYQAAVEAIYAVTLRLEALISENGTMQKNFLVSPISAAMLIGQLMLGAEQETENQLHNLLSISALQRETNVTRITNSNQYISQYLPYGLLHIQLGGLISQFKTISANSSFTLEVANALFYDKPIKLKHEFLKNIEQFYNAETRPLEFSTQPQLCQKTINDWGSQHTNGLIRTILNEPPPIGTSSIFANAIYFKGDWATPFSNLLNQEAPFQINSKESVNVTYMQNFLEDIPFYKCDKRQLTMISMPYKDNDLAMYILLPDLENKNAFNVNAFSQSLRASDIFEMISKATINDVSVRIPRMSLTNTINLIEPLKKYFNYVQSKNQDKKQVLKDYFKNRQFKDSLDDLENKVDAFKKYNTTSNSLKDIVLTNAAENQNLVISNLFQEITLNINEKGTEAAAVSAGIIDYMGGSKVFNVDRPFVFFVRHKATSAVLFWGTIYNPLEN